MFTLLWERLSPKQRHRALYSALIVSLCAYLMLALIGEPLQSFRADLEPQSHSVAIQESVR